MIFYSESFQQGEVPVGWRPWEPKPWELSWDGALILQDGQPGYARGMFYQFDPGRTNLTVEFRFRASATPSHLIEIIDLYDAHVLDTDLNEECNVYLHEDRRISFFIGYGSIKVKEQIPIGQWIWIRLRFNVVEGVSSSGDVCWSFNREYDESGPRFASSSRGFYSKPVRMCLFGPVSQTNLLFTYDDLTLAETHATVLLPVTDLRGVWIKNSIVAEWTDKSVGQTGYELEMRIRAIAGTEVGPWSNQPIIKRHG